MKNKDHLNLIGLNQILAYKNIINFGLSKNLKDNFPDIIILEKPIYTPSNELLDPNWICGFITGDGSFYVTRNSANKIQPFMSITLNPREKHLLLKIQQYFNGIGSIYPKNLFNPDTLSPKSIDYKVYKLSDLIFIVNFFNKNKLMGMKLKNFSIWKEIISLIEKKAHLTSEGLIQINFLCNQLNKKL